MTETTQTTRYVYMVNNTKKDIRVVPLVVTGDGKNIGFIDGMYAIIKAVKAGWDNFTKYNWEPSDNINFLKDEEFNLEQYTTDGYELN